MKNEEIKFEEIYDPTFRRKEEINVKSEAIRKIFLELDGLINVSKFAKIFFNKSQSWFLQRINGYNVNNKPAKFTSEEYDKIALSFRELAKRLNDYADEIDKAQK